MQSCTEAKIEVIDDCAPPVMAPEETKQVFGKILATNAFHPPPLKRMKGSRNIFDLVKLISNFL